MLIGAQYSSKSSARDQLLIYTNSDSFVCWDVTKGRTCDSQSSSLAGSYFTENKGFFIVAAMDDVTPYNTIFSLYDALTISSLRHFATVNSTQR